jgi:enamine deaminase RidA (YjgF/YER057c/UK114 family)
MTHLTEYLAVDALPRYDELRTEPAGEATVTTIVVESLPGRASYRVETEAPPVGAGAVVLPTVLPVDGHGEIVHEGDFVGQYAWCLEEAGRQLEALGLSLDAAVTTYDYSTPATRDVYRRTHRERKDRLGGAGVYPGAGGILMSRLHRPGVLVALDVTASRLPLTAVNPGWSRYETLTYTPGVLAGDTLYMSGFAALDMETQEALFPGDAAAQAEATYAAVQQVLDAAGATADRLAHVLEYVCPDGDAAEVAAARERWFPGAKASTAGCAALLRPEFLLEVFPTAVLAGGAG